MLPRPLYKVLPYLYIAAGLLCWVMLDTNIVVIPTAILVLTGLLVLWMRRKAKQGSVSISKDSRPVGKGAHLYKKVSKRKIRFGERRFPAEAPDFPITDGNHNMVAFNRRTGGRRKDEDE